MTFIRTAVPPYRLTLLALLALPPRLAAQYDACRPGAGSNEAKTLAMFSLPLAFSPVAAPGGPQRFTLGVEASRVPSVDPATATPTICRPGKGPENTDLLPALGRLRVGLPLPLGFAVEGSWIPPLRVNGVKSDLFGFALSKQLGHPNGFAAALRAHATFGSVHAPVTCDADALTDPASECFHGMISDDHYSPNIMGIDASIGWATAGGRLRPYLGSGYNRMEPRFHVNFTNQFGQTDRTEVEVNLDRLVLFGGAAWQLTSQLNVTGEIYAAPADGATARFVIRRALGS
jgi:hypothetical protein